MASDPIWRGRTAQTVAPGPMVKSYLIDSDVGLLLPVERDTEVVVLTAEQYESIQAERVAAVHAAANPDVLGAYSRGAFQGMRTAGETWVDSHPREAAQRLIGAGHLEQADVWDRAPSDPDRVRVYYEDETVPPDAVPLYRLVLPTEETNDER